MGLFIYMFWVLFHGYISLYIVSVELLLFSDSNELTYSNTFLLSNAAISLGCCYHGRKLLVLFGSSNFISFLIGLEFLFLQIKEFRNISFYNSDSNNSSVFYFLSGLHFFHVVVALIIVIIFVSFLESYYVFCLYSS